MNDIVNEALNLFPACEKARFIRSARCAEIEMDVSIADVTEADGASAGNRAQNGGGSTLEKLRNCTYGYRNVVLDRCSFAFLRFGQILAQRPQRSTLAFAFGKDGVADEAFLAGRSKRTLDCCFQIELRRAARFDQYVPWGRL